MILEFFSSSYLDLSENVLPLALNILTFIWPIVLPLLLFEIFWSKWLSFIRNRFLANQEYILLEFKLPKDNFKSPAAMELAILSFHQGLGESNWYQRYWLGSVRPYFSLEMVSIEGQVKFYAWMRKGSRKAVETAMYSQFPNLEIYVVNDYTHSFNYDPKTDEMAAFEFALNEADVYPIKTYIDYGLDKDPKEEFKIDPLTPSIEFLGSIGANQQVWVQILVRSHKKDYVKKGFVFKEVDKFKDEALALISKLKSRDAKTKFPVTDEKSKLGISMTKGEEEIITAVERAITKPQFDVGIRGIYMAKKENFDGANIGGLTGMFKQYGSANLNGFGPNLKKYSPSFSYPWDDFMGILKRRAMHSALRAFKRRAMFYDCGLYSKIFTLNSEELATIYHFPGRVSSTPTFERVSAKKGEPPANLPI